jgi:hypothetical protein
LVILHKLWVLEKKIWSNRAKLTKYFVTHGEILHNFYL